MAAPIYNIEDPNFWKDLEDSLFYVSIPSSTPKNLPRQRYFTPEQRRSLYTLNSDGVWISKTKAAKKNIRETYKETVRGTFLEKKHRVD